MLLLDESTASHDKEAELKVFSSLPIVPELNVIAINRNLELLTLFDEVHQVKDEKIEEVIQLNTLSVEVVYSNSEVITYF